MMKFNLTKQEIDMLQSSNISRQAFANRITQCKWSKLKALHEPIMERQLTTQEERELMKRNNLSSTTLSKRISRGWSRYQALRTPVRKKALHTVS